MDPIEVLARVAPAYVIFLFSLCFHEFAHGWVALLRGDSTAKMMGRLTLNPTAHADLFGTVIFPIMGMATGIPFLFGWAKPVPVNERNLERPRQDMFWIAFAGPLSNLLLAAIGVFVGQYLGVWGRYDSLVPERTDELFLGWVRLNLALAFFNLIPLGPLDGAKVLARFLPEAWNKKIEEHDQILSMVLLALLFTGIFQLFLRLPISWTFEQMRLVAKLVV